MYAIVYVIGSAVNGFLTVMQVLMVVRALLSWLPVDTERPLIQFVYAATEFIVAPVRALLYRFEKLQELPIDISFLVAYFLLMILSTILSNAL